MTSTDSGDSGPETGEPKFNEIDLNLFYDDLEDPGEVTICSTTSLNRATTHWIKIDVEYTISLEEVR